MARAEERKAEAVERRFSPVLQTFLRAEITGGKRKPVLFYNGVLGFYRIAAVVTVTGGATATGTAAMSGGGSGSTTSCRHDTWLEPERTRRGAAAGRG